MSINLFNFLDKKNKMIIFYIINEFSLTQKKKKTEFRYDILGFFMSDLGQT